MKKFVCMIGLLLMTLIVQAKAQLKAYAPPEQDIGYQTVATLSIDGMPVATFDALFNIVDLQTPVMLKKVSNLSAQVVDAYNYPTPMGDVSMTLVCYMWPDHESDTMNNRSDYNADYSQSYCAYYTHSFTAQQTDFT